MGLWAIGICGYGGNESCDLSSVPGVCLHWWPWAGAQLEFLTLTGAIDEETRAMPVPRKCHGAALV